MQILEHSLQVGIGVHVFVDVEVVTALDEGAEPLAVGDRHIVFLFA